MVADCGRGTVSATMHVTIKDIAERAGVSKTTVSFAFNSPEKISEETRNRVLAIAADLGYVPDPIARTLITKRIGTVGLLLPQPIPLAMKNPYLTEMIQGIGAVCHKHNFSLTIVPPSRGRVIEAAERAVVDGLITIGIAADVKIIEFLKKRNLPFVTVDGTASDETVNVGIDDEKAGYSLMRSVLDMGHRRIAVIKLEGATAIHPEERFSSVRDRRMAGFERALAENGMSLDDVRTASAEVSIEGGHNAGVELLSSGPRPTVVMAMADIIAIGFYTACRERGIRIPADISVTGFDDIQMASLITPTLTTIHQPGYTKGFEAGQIMFALIEHEAAYHRFLSSELVVRESIGVPAMA